MCQCLLKDRKKTAGLFELLMFLMLKIEEGETTTATMAQLQGTHSLHLSNLSLLSLALPPHSLFSPPLLCLYFSRHVLPAFLPECVSLSLSLSFSPHPLSCSVPPLSSLFLFQSLSRVLSVVTALAFAV